MNIAQLYPHSKYEDNEKTVFTQHRVFLYNIDTYNTRYIASFLTDQIYGASKEGVDFGEGEEEVPTEETETLIKLPTASARYEIIGTLKEIFHQKSEDILYTVNPNFKDTYKHELLCCGFLIFDISKNKEVIPKVLEALDIIEEELERVKEVGPKTFENLPEVRSFILISSVLTWALTKPIDPEEPDTPFTEADYRKRKSYPNHKELLDCEREVVLRGRKYKEKLKTYVLCSGITYGMEEDDLFFYFKMAWNNQKYLPIFKPGNNIVPLIHVKDLAKAVHGLCEATPSKPQFILAVEQTPSNLKQIVKALSKNMGSGKVREVTKEEAFLYDDIQQRNFECCTLNLNMEPSFIADDLEIEWQNELSLAENMPAIISEFRNARNLKPFKVIIHGPPAIGKTVLAREICEDYGTHYISVKTMIDETVADLKETIESEKAKQKLKEEKENKEETQNIAEEKAEEEEEEDEEEIEIEELEEQLRDIENTLQFSETGKLPDELVVKLMQNFLKKNICQNQGYVLDGYPKTLQQTVDLFGGGADATAEEEAEEEEEGGGGSAGKFTPDFVISLEATDEFLCQRIMQKPESEIQGTHYTEEHMLRRLDYFSANNTEDNTLLNFFNEREIHPIIINVMELKEVANVTKNVYSYFGPPVGFPLTDEEESERYKIDEERARLIEQQESIKQEIMEKQALEQYELNMEEWTKLLEDMQIEEEKLLVAQSEPLRNYLMQFVFPVLTKGLLEVARRKPDDPVDFLAEYLFKENPEGRMFDPAYTRTGEIIERKYCDQIDF